MGFKPLSNNNDDRASTLPWIEEYLDCTQDAVNECFDIKQIKLRAKGALLITDEWIAFLFKSTSGYKHLIQFIEAWHSSKQASPVLQAKIIKHKPCYMLGTDDERKAGWSKQEDQGWNQHYGSVQDNPEYRENPLPLPSSPSMSTSHASTSMRDADYYASDAQDLPLEEATKPLNGTSGTKTPKRRRGAL